MWSAESEFHEVFTAAGDLFAIVVEDPHGPLFLVHFSQHTIAGIVNASGYDYNPATKAIRKTNNEAKGLAASRFGGLLHLAMEAGIGDKSRGRKELKIVLAFLMRLRGLNGKWDGSTFDAIYTIIAAGHYERHVDRRVWRCGEVIARGLNEVDTLVLRLFLGMTYWNMLLTAYGKLTNHNRLSPIEVSPNVPHEAWDGGDLDGGDLPPGWQRYATSYKNYIYRNTRTGYECRTLRAAIMYDNSGDGWRKYSDSELPKESHWQAKDSKESTLYRKGNREFAGLPLARHYEQYGDRYIKCDKIVAPGWERRAEQYAFRYRKGDLECHNIPTAKHLDVYGWYEWGKCDKRSGLPDNWMRRPRCKGSTAFEFKDPGGEVFATLKAAKNHASR